MQQFLLSIMVMFSLSSCSQEQPELEKNSFLGYWGPNESQYYLSVKNIDEELKFTTYKFLLYEDEGDELAWNRVLSPGTEEFIKFEDNVVVTNYWIDQQEYYTKVTYTLIDDQNMKAEFNGKLKGEFYYGIINYKRLNINPNTKHEN
tara:strand:- start:523 stop:963 length:441 start_codon:yes stop_codon:yes gene_type:complete